MENFGLQVCSQLLLPGFRFHPTDQELIIHYLRKKVTSNSSSSSTPATTSIIAEIDLYKYNPWELPDKSLIFGEGGEWFFFSPRDRKYPNGARPNRAAGCGYWKATGTDKPILASGGSKCLGVKKALVFYKGRPPKGFKTDWVMHEYRLIDATPNPSSSSTHNKHIKGTSMRLDDWVLCRVRQKGCTPIQSDEKHDLQLGISTGINQQVAAPMITNSEKQQLPAVEAGNSTSTVTAGGINNRRSSDFYEWSEDQLLAYLISSSQQEEAEAEGLGENTASTDHNSRSTNSSSLCLNNNNISFLQGHAAAAAAATNHYMQPPPPPPPPQAAVSSMLDSIKRTLSFGALDEFMLQPPSKRLHYCYINGDDQLSPTSSFSVDQAFPDFGM